MKTYVISYRRCTGGYVKVEEKRSFIGVLWWFLRKAAGCQVFIVSRVEE